MWALNKKRLKEKRLNQIRLQLLEELRKDETVFLNVPKEEQFYEFALTAVKLNGFYLQGLREDLKTDEVIKAAISQNGAMIQVIEDQKEEYCRLAIEQSPHSFTHIRLKTKELCLFAVQKDGRLLNYVPEQTKEICEVAIRNNPVAVRFIRRPYWDKSLFYLAANLDWKMLKHIPESMQDIELNMRIYEKHPESVEFMSL